MTLKQQLSDLVFTIQNDFYLSKSIMEMKVKFMAKLPSTSSSHKRQKQQQQQQLAKDRILQVTLTPLISTGKLMILFVVEDVTHFNEIKVLETLNKNKSNMMSQVSHEIRNPVSCIIAMLEEIQTVTHTHPPTLASSNSLPPPPHP